MKTIKMNSMIKLISLIALFLTASNLIQAQEFNLSNTESELKVYGTSSLHDWHIDAENKSGKIVFKNIEAGELEKCDFTVIAESLKSGKKSMDKNTYKALKTDEYKTIKFKLEEVKEIVKKGPGKFLLKSTGYLTITNAKKLIPIEFNIEIVEGKVKLSGEKTIKMTDFNVEPPKALLGTITTGDEITIKFNTIYK
ncbi:YceI family protein [Flaviramulus sp. BrNp1-15]|uniref:YceI family protein n=1 Tax=Flaviramulus sp. BrNp1-15 TaxID=2916754 RepID=UPI001EE95AB6|nr:YceI family protein [Flaviramulus sp. BrNp1-15]ULC58827.1 YceI family protein [Flaviramulus sp. BrNp1-15]